MDLFPFNADLTDRILTYLPNCSSLLSAILSSRFVCSVYKAHPNSIIRAIFYNQLGAALPQALRLVRCENINLRQSPISELCAEDELGNEPVITCEEAAKLARHLKVVCALEDLFSWREKDRTSSTSRLSDIESVRFRRAIYRIWLFSSIYGRSNILDEDLYFDQDDEEANADMLELITKQRGFMSQFSTPELQELERAMRFLMEIASWAAMANSPYLGFNHHWIKYALFCGPQTILQTYNGNLDELDSLRDLDQGEQSSWFDTFLSDAIMHNLQQRRIQETLDYSGTTILLDNVNGKEDRCKQCDKVQGLSLWNTSNWYYLRGSMLPENFSQSMKGLSGRNVADRSLFLDICYNTPFATLLDEIWDQKTPSYDHWDKQDWLCIDCIMTFIREHVYVWWVERNRKLGRPIQPDCWYGYNCRTQTHSMHHASRLNHLCEPTRGSGS